MTAVLCPEYTQNAARYLPFSHLILGLPVGDKILGELCFPHDFIKHFLLERRLKATTVKRTTELTQLTGDLSEKLRL